MSSVQLLDVTGRRRSPTAMPGHHAGRAPRNKGTVYPADPPTVDEIVAVMRKIPCDRHGADDARQCRTRALNPTQRRRLGGNAAALAEIGSPPARLIVAAGAQKQQRGREWYNPIQAAACRRYVSVIWRPLELT
jgi:hypothetical protein